MPPDGSPEYDAVIIGAGVAGLYQLYRLRQLGLSVRVFEAGGGVGGTWYWNRYPGARFDSESYTYAYSFSDELIEEWDWKERFSGQPENLRYLEHVADRFDLRRDITFDARVHAARFDDGANQWVVELEDGSRARGRLLITAIGVLSAPVTPQIEGIDDFAGESYRTARWPHEPVGFDGKRVAVIGTGATGVQVIQEVAKTAGHLTVFQRTANWCAPLHNGPIGDDEQQRLKTDAHEIFDQCNATFGGFIHDADPRKAMEVSAAEREELYEKLYREPGFGIWMGNFRDVLVDEEANRTLSDFVARKIRERVDDPETAEKLVPEGHGFGTRRVPLETRYYEVYNQPNVDLVDLRATPIERITATGIRTTEGDLPFDMIIYATGFDAVTGPFERIDFEGVGGVRLKEKWAPGPRTLLGIQTAGFPNMFTLVGPHNAATFCNMPRCIEQNVDWVTDCIVHMRAEGATRIEATEAAETDWTDHVVQSGDRMLFTKVDSWFMGVNSNVEGRQDRRFILYAGGAPLYKEKCDEAAAADYAGFVLSSP